MVGSQDRLQEDLFVAATWDVGGPDRLSIEEHKRRLEHKEHERRQREFDALPVDQKIETRLDRWRSIQLAYKKRVSQEEEQRKRIELYEYYSANNGS